MRSLNQSSHWSELLPDPNICTPCFVLGTVLRVSQALPHCRGLRVLLGAPKASPWVPSGCWHWVPLGCLLDSQPLTMKWFHIDRQKKPQTNQTTTKNQTPFWMWVLMHSIIMEPAAPPSPLSPSQASLRRAWLQMAFSCLRGGGVGGYSPYLPSTAGGEILSLINNWLPAIASPLLAQAPSLTLCFRNRLPFASPLPSPHPAPW